MIPITKTVRDIIEDVRENRDTSILTYNKMFDNNPSSSLKVSQKEIRQAYSEIDPRVIELCKKAIQNISLFSRRQLRCFKDFTMKINGNVLGQTIIPIEKIGVYVPGGNYPYPSTAIMGVVPARIAGCREIIVCSPKIRPETIVAADMAGATKIFNVGGVQAIAGMAMGTKQIPKVDKIIGPGNAYVAEAKRQLYGEVGIDMIAGPTELCIIADDSADPSYVAADLLAQAEHDINAKTFLITNSKKLVGETMKEIQKQLTTLQTKSIAEKSIKNIRIFFLKNKKNIICKANEIAPEHLSLMVGNPEQCTGKLKNYGSLFIGNNSAEVYGDYFSGTNHILPTSTAARYTGGVSVGTFLKVLTYQKITKKGLKEARELAEGFAKIEGLDGHARSARVRK